jgi:hypothetical protein
MVVGGGSPAEAPATVRWPPGGAPRGGRARGPLPQGPLACLHLGRAVWAQAPLSSTSPPMYARVSAPLTRRHPVSPVCPVYSCHSCAPSLSKGVRLWHPRRVWWATQSAARVWHRGWLYGCYSLAAHGYGATGAVPEYPYAATK